MPWLSPRRVGRRAHAVEQQRVVAPARGGVVVVAARVDPHVARPPPVELREEGPEPVLVLVIDGDRQAILDHRSPLSTHRYPAIMRLRPNYSAQFFTVILHTRQKLFEEIGCIVGSRAGFRMVLH